jgi:hypothetical protein
MITYMKMYNAGYWNMIICYKFEVHPSENQPKENTHK